ncbi:hypothetical protein EO244_04375 [Ancylomarina salipaludis]|uniref:Uncharacterized protein n=1 Tax=Ancylomarina salipaludis TaxID=2501299 RepID=A0A4Q1JPB5_9BACT|nr:hypothetical protein [Ancylomarina salipaludis]RXQ96085.1 hypothetical protein EO244_04375 [Ancylomarina salipaludis]
MSNKTQRDIKFLKVYSGLLTLALMGIIIFLLSKPRQTNFEEINVERINVVEKNGDLKLVISNSKRQHQGVVNGKLLPKRNRQAGLIFFNSVGDECGGLIYDGNDKEAGLVLSVDKFRDDQVMQLRYIENTEKNHRMYGLQLWDYPKEDSYDERSESVENLQKIQDPKERDVAYLKMKEEGVLPENRMFVGKKMNKDVGVFINDNKGNPRIRIFIDKDNNPKIELLDEKGKTINQQ